MSLPVAIVVVILCTIGIVLLSILWEYLIDVSFEFIGVLYDRIKRMVR